MEDCWLHPDKSQITEDEWTQTWRKKEARSFLAKRRLHQRGYSQEFPQFLGDREGSVAFAVCTANVYEQPR